MKRLIVLLGVVAGCSGGSASQALVEVVKEGDGDAVVSSLSTGLGTRWTYAVTEDTQTTVAEVLDDGLMTLPNGAVVHREITPAAQAPQTGYYAQEASGTYYWGSSDGDLFDTPLCTVSLPLKLNREWTSSTDAHPGWYRFRVEAVEDIQTPAGRFHTARLVQWNTRSGAFVTRWYADRVGMVQRVGPGASSTDAQTLLLNFSGQP
jgi:hypothetical protein